METTIVSNTDLEPLIQEMFRRMEYLENSLLLRTAKVADMCEAFQLLGQLSRVAVANDPTTFSRVHFNITNVVAQSRATGYLILSHCVPVELEFITQNKTDTCFSRIPVNFRDHLGQSQYGYLSPHQPTLHTSSPKADRATFPAILFTIGEQIYEYKPPKIPRRIDESKATWLSMLRSNLTSALVTLHDDWAFHKEDLTHTSTQDAIASFVNQQLQDLRNEGNQRSEPETHPTVVSKTSFLSLHSLFACHIFDALATWCFRIIVDYLFCYHIVHHTSLSFRACRNDIQIRRGHTQFQSW